MQRSSNISNTITPTSLDHIIILVPNSYLKPPSTPSWLAQNFTITPGGQHADGKTENTLITLADGVYLELIAFVNDEERHRQGHWWGGKRSCSVVDWCLTGQLDNNNAETLIKTLAQREKDKEKEEKKEDGEEEEEEEDEGEGRKMPFKYYQLLERVSSVQQDFSTTSSAKNSAHLSGTLSYAIPVHGGRNRPDGKRVEWAVTFPTLETKSISDPSTPQKSRPPGIPFFCHDITPRPLRLSTDMLETKTNFTTHPSGAVGIAYIQVGVPKSQLGTYAHVIAAVMNGKVEDRDDEKDEQAKLSIRIGTPEGGRANVYIVEQDRDAEIGVVEIGLKVRKTKTNVELIGKTVGEGEIRFRFIEEYL